MAPSFPLVGFAESCGLHDGVTNLKTHDHSYWNYFQKHSTHPPALMRDLSSSLGVRFLGSGPHGWFSQPQAVPPSLSFPGLLCWYSPPTLQGVNRAEVLWTSQMKEAGEAEPNYYPYKAWRGSRGWLLSYCSSRTDLLLHSALAASTGERAQSSSSQCHFRIDFPNMSYPTAQTIFPLLYESVILYRCLNAFFQLATSPVGYWL